jgi:hypothetical protein
MSRRGKIERTDGGDSPEVSDISSLNLKESRQGESNVDSAQGQRAVYTNHHRSSHLDIVNDEERKDKY